MDPNAVGVKVEKNPPQSKLTELGVTKWPKYQMAATKIPWTFTSEETMYFLEGKVQIEVDGHEGCFTIGAGDLVVVPKGLKVTWNVIEPMNKHYKSGN